MDTYMMEFINYLQYERGYSDNTIQSYRYDLRQFLVYLGQEKLEERRVQEYLDYLHSQRLSASTILRKKSVVIQFLSYLYHENIIDFQYVAEQTITVPSRLPKSITQQQVAMLMVAPKEGQDKCYLRDRLILQWLYGYGVRVSELVSVTVLQCDPHFITILGKGNKQRRIIRHQSEKRVCDYYIQEFRQNRGADQLFVTVSGKPLTRFAIHQIVQKYAKRCGMPDVSSHWFRHSFAVHLLESGANLYSVQRLLGHSSIQTTQGYTALSMGYRRHIYQKAHPRSC